MSGGGEAKGGEDPTALNDLGSVKLGGSVLFATDEWFASADNLLQPHDPVWNEEFSPYGKWMDGWETRRKRIVGHDYAIIELGHLGTVEAIDFDTCHFSGNFAPAASVQACAIRPGDALHATVAKMKKLRNEERSWRADGFAGTRSSDAAVALEAALGSASWTTLVPKTELRTGAPATRHNIVRVSSASPVTHLRLNIFPDGGVARLRVYGRIQRDWTATPAGEVLDLAAAVNGGEVVDWSDAHYGHPRNMIGPGRAPNMGDGWETARKTGRPSIIKADASGRLILPGDDWALFKLACPGEVREILIDTNHFKGNCPESCKLEGAMLPARASKKDALAPGVQWRPILERTALRPHTEMTFEPTSRGPFSHFRVTIFPDGGISRIRLFGTVAGAAKL